MIDEVGDLQIPFLSPADEVDGPVNDEAEPQEIHASTEFGLPDPSEYPDSLVISHLAASFQSKDPKKAADFKALEKASESLDKLKGIPATAIKRKIDSVIENSKDIANNLGDRKDSRRLQEAQTSIAGLRSVIDEVSANYPEDYKECAEACKDLSGVLKNSNFDYGMHIIEKSSEGLNPWEAYRTDLMWKWEPSTDKRDKIDISEAVVATIGMNSGEPFDHDKLKQNAEKLRKIPGFNELPSNVIKDYMKEDMLGNFAFNIRHPFDAENIYKPNVDTKHNAFSEINYIRKNILDRSSMRSKE